MLKCIIATDNIILITTTLLFIFGSIGVIVLILYNNYYTKKKSRYFLKFFYGDLEISENTRIEDNLNVSIYAFFLLYFLYSINLIKTAKDVFPSREENIKPLQMFPNSYREELDVFLESNRLWVKINICSFILILVICIWVCVYLFFN